ncbi:MAG: hypothetical protein HQK49_11740 [Oligoflexia bacterium]|nr:hypothetical protein [Oligoflexia bacterium]
MQSNYTHKVTRKKKINFASNNSNNLTSYDYDTEGMKDFFISCNRLCEDVLIKELQDKSMGGFGSEFAFAEESMSKGFAGVHFRGSMKDAFKIILHSRVASRVYWKLASFEISLKKDHEKEVLYDIIKKIDWCNLFSAKESIKINAILGRGLDQRLNSHYIAQIAKDAVVDSFREQYGQRPNVNTAFPNVPIMLFFERDNLDVLVDLCGEPLGNRHYRQTDFAAPLRENLAASILHLMNWQSNKEVFIDCMCGSGTMVVEALLYALKIPPSFIKVRRALSNDRNDRLKNRWTLENLKIFKESNELKESFKELLKEVNHQVKDVTKNKNTDKNTEKITIFAHDINFRAISTTKTHISFIERELARRLIGEVVFIKSADATTLKKPVQQLAERKGGIIFANPPYGVRLGNDGDDNGEELENLYHNFGENLKLNFKDFRAYIFTGNLELRKKISLQTSSRIELFNGDIDCRLFKYELY